MLIPLRRAEQEVANLLIKGAGNQDIARTLSKSVRTVETQVASILRKNGCSSRYEYMALVAGSSGINDHFGTHSTIEAGPTLADVERVVETYRSWGSGDERRLLSFLPSVIEEVVERAFSKQVSSGRKRVVILGATRRNLSLGAVAKARGDDPIFIVRSTEIHKQAEYIPDELRIPLIRDFQGELTDLAPDMIIASISSKPNDPCWKSAIERNIPVISCTEYAYQLAKSPIIAVGGTWGKSNVALMTHFMLQAAGKNSISCSLSPRIAFNERQLVEAAFESDSRSILITDVSCFELDFVEGFRPKVAAITTLEPDHMDRYGTFSKYVQVERRLLSRMSFGDTVVCNSSESRTFPPKGNKARVLSWSDKAKKDSDAYVTENSVVVQDHEIPIGDVYVSMPGDLNHVLCASLLALGADAPRDDLQWIVQGMKDFRKAIENNLQRGEPRIAYWE